jgi:nucleoside-diphosphate-sugar epimerase
MYIKHDLYRDDIKKILDSDLEWEKIYNSSIFITGATGLIGTVLVDTLMTLTLEKGANITVYAMGRNGARVAERFADYMESPYFVFVQGDVNDHLEFDRKVDYLFHCASNTHPRAYATDPIGTIMSNVIGTNHVLSYARTCEAKRVVFLSTVEIYGENRGDVEKFTEDYSGYIDCNTMRAGYPEGKRTGEALCQAYISKYGMDVVIPRICRVYGSTMLDTDSKALAQFIRNAVNNEDIVLKSEGTQYYSYCYVADVVSALFYTLIKGKSGEAYNIADESSDIYLKDLAAILAELSGRNVIFELPDATESKGFSKATKAILDANKLKEFGWNAKENINSGLERTVYLLKEIL